MHLDNATLKDQFHQIFGFDAPGQRMCIVRAPGRVNLIGEHTDYNEGFVFPMAIEPEVRIVCRSRADANVRLASTLFPGSISEFSLLSKIEPVAHGSWDNYSRGVAAGLRGAGIPLVGMDALIFNSLPPGGGLSSSAAVEVATARALLKLAGSEMDDRRLALLCQKAEQEFAGVPVGIMDQTIVAAAKANHAMLLDCRDQSRQYIPIDSHEMRVVVINSMVKHALSDGEYAKRRRECEEGLAFFQKAEPNIKALRDVTLSAVEAARDKLPDVIFRRCRHVVSENARTRLAATELNHRNYEEVGRLMLQSHASMRDDYEISTPEMDFLVAEAMKVRNVYGARLTGGGFGGCIIAIAQPRTVDALISQVSSEYASRFGKKPIAFATSPAAGASIID